MYGWWAILLATGARRECLLPVRPYEVPGAYLPARGAHVGPRCTREYARCGLARGERAYACERKRVPSRARARALKVYERVNFIPRRELRRDRPKACRSLVPEA